MTGRGATIAEILVALVLSLLLAELALGSLVSIRRAELAVLERSERAQTLRVARSVLRAELRVGAHGIDWIAAPPDSVLVRAFRGLGLVCPGSVVPGRFTVAWSGYRAPDPAKDSLLILRDDGRWIATELLAVAASAAPCASHPPHPSHPLHPLRRVARWTTTDTVSNPLLARFFESGSYHVSGGALRYRRGAAGRQPLTPEALGTPPSGFRGTGPLWVDLGGPGFETWRWSGRIGGSSRP